ncbi:hypothetical protein Dimus_035256 [Dionaea muscipula]
MPAEMPPPGCQNEDAPPLNHGTPRSHHAEAGDGSVPQPQSPPPHSPPQQLRGGVVGEGLCVHPSFANEIPYFQFILLGVRLMDSVLALTIDLCLSDFSASEAEDSSEYIQVDLQKIHKEVQCPICLGIIKNTRTVKECLHRFCRECIDKSMRLGNNECPTCRTHCASRRSLTDDPRFDAIIAALFPDIELFEEELGLHEEEKTHNMQVQASIAQISKRQSDAAGKKRLAGNDRAGSSGAGSRSNYRCTNPRRRRRRRRSSITELRDSEDSNNDNEEKNYHLQLSTLQKSEREREGGGWMLDPLILHHQLPTHLGNALILIHSRIVKASFYPLA